MAARGIAPGLKPGDTLTVIALLAEFPDEAIAAVAQATLGKLPAPLLNGALSGDLPAGVIDLLALRYVNDALLAQKILALPSIAPETVADMASKADEALAEFIATNEERLLKNPRIIEKLYMNKATRMSTSDRLIELAVRNGIEVTGIPAFREAATAIANELIPEPSIEPTPDDILFKETDAIAERTELAPEEVHHVDEASGEEVVNERALPLHAQIGKMSISQKIRRAMLGNSAERMLLVRDSNKLVCTAAVRSPMMQEREIVQISASRSVPEEVLRLLANSKKWSGLHEVKYNLVSNPRCPFALASKFLSHMHEHELKVLAKSKNVPGAVAAGARQILQRRKK
jgi:hypothetical protein